MASSDNGKQSLKRRLDPPALTLEWDWGTAYELLFSLSVLVNPKRHNIPAPWAAGVRKRLSTQAQSELKLFYAHIMPPMAYSMPEHLVLEMPRPKNARRFIEYVESIPDDQFIRRAHMQYMREARLQEISDKVMSGKKATDAEVEEYRRLVKWLLPELSSSEIRRVFAEMADPAGTKQRWLSLLREYYNAFYAEQEERDEPALQRLLADAQALAHKTTARELIEQLSHGVAVSDDTGLDGVVLVPSVWLHPLAVVYRIEETKLFVAWGSRPPGYRLVPGPAVPDEALLVLRALSDPTRLRLLRLLAAEPRSLQALAHEVKLSLPTVSHHMRELRMAGMLRLEVGGKGRETRYSVRWSNASEAFEQLEEFVLPRGSQSSVVSSQLGIRNG